MRKPRALFLKIFAGILACSFLCILLIVITLLMTLGADLPAQLPITSILAAAALFTLAVAVILSFLFSKWAYTPVQSVLQEKSQLENTTWQYSQIIVEKLLLDLIETPVSVEEFDALFRKYKVSLATPFSLCLITIRGWRSFSGRPIAEQQSDWHALRNAAHEMLGICCDSVSAYVEAVRGVLFFLHLHPGTDEPTDLLDEMHDTILGVLGLDCRIFYSLQPITPPELPARYNAFAYLAESSLFSPDTVLFDADVAPEVPPEPSTLDKDALLRQCAAIGHKLVSQGSGEAVEEYLGFLRAKIGNLGVYRASYDAILASWEQVLLLLRNAGREEGLAAYQLPSRDFHSFETIAEVEEFIRMGCQQLIGLGLSQKTPQYARYVEQTDALLSEHFRNPMFGVQQLADAVGLSAPYLSKVYKNATGTTWPP